MTAIRCKALIMVVSRYALVYRFQRIELTLGGLD
jgi:hypothetical protein